MLLLDKAIAGHHGTATAKILDASKIPETSTKTLPSNRRDLSSTEQDQINTSTDQEGYPIGSSRQAMATDADLDSKSPQEILNGISIALEKFKENPNKHTLAIEKIPSIAEIQKSLKSEAPLKANQLLSYSYPSAGTGGKDYRHGELSMDADSVSQGSKTTAQSWTEAATRRHEPLLRMKNDWGTAFHGTIQRTRSADDPSAIYEIKCPLGHQPDGSYVQYLNGDAVTITPNMTIVASPSGVIEIKDEATGVVVEAGLDHAPVDTVYREDHGYKVKRADIFNDFSKSSGNRRVVEIQDHDLAFKSRVQKVCKKYKRELDLAVQAHKMLPSQAGDIRPALIRSISV